MEKNNINYYIYKDDKFMKHIYSQLFDELPDIGIIEYIDSRSNLNTVDWRAEGENFTGEAKKINSRGEIRYSDSNGINRTRVMANINIVSDIISEGMYNNIVKKIQKNKCDCIDNLCYVTGKLIMTENDLDNEDIFIKLGDDLLWLKESFLDTKMSTLINILDEVSVIGFIIKTKSENGPRILKVIAMYL